MGTGISQEENSRIFSIMKGLGIIFIVAGHTLYPPVRNFVYLFHLAIFYFVAGYFFNDKYVDNKLLFVWKKIKSLWFPLVGYGSAFLLLHNFFFRIHIYSPQTNHLYTQQDYLNGLKLFCRFSAQPDNLLGALWFLKSLFITSIVFMAGVWISKKLSGRYSDIILGAGILLLVTLCSIFHTEIQQINSMTVRGLFSNECYLVALLYLGRIFRKYQRNIPVNPYFLILLFLVLLFLQYKNVRINIVASTFPALPVFYFASAAGCLFTYMLSVYIYKIRGGVQRAMVYVGDASLAIMALHFLAFKAINLLQIPIYGYSIHYLSEFPVIINHIAIWWFPYVLCGTAIPLIYTYSKQIIIRSSGLLYERLTLRFKS